MDGVDCDEFINVVVNMMFVLCDIDGFIGCVLLEVEDGFWIDYVCWIDVDVV